MRYWTLFTLRMMARLWLFLAVVSWCLPVHAYAAGPIRGGQMIIGLFNHGWFVRWSPSAPWATWEGAIRRARDPADFRAQFDAIYTIQDFAVPGVTIYRTTDDYNYQLLRVDHWLVFLTFLIATIATSVRWRKPAAEQEQERAGE